MNTKKENLPPFLSYATSFQYSVAKRLIVGGAKKKKIKPKMEQMKPPSLDVLFASKKPFWIDFVGWEKQTFQECTQLSTTLFASSNEDPFRNLRLHGIL